MLQVRVKFFGPLHDVVGGQPVEITMPQGASVKDLLSCLVDKFGEKFAERVLTSEGKPQNYVEMFVDGSQVDPEHLDVSLAPEGAATAEVSFYILLLAVGGS